MNCFGCMKERFGKWLVIVPVVALALFFGVRAYVDAAFPKSRCEAFKHLKNPDGTPIDCFECHKKVSPKIAQDWYESKHGVTLVKCFVCHGQPDDKGAVPFSAKPSVQGVCVRCHEPAIARMKAKFGLRAEDCSSCHPFHMNSLHHEAYERTESAKEIKAE